MKGSWPPNVSIPDCQGQVASVHAHNEFLLAFFNKCQAPCAGRESSSSTHVRDKLKKLKSKVKPVRVTFEKRFVPVAVTRHVPTAREPAAERSLDLCLRERCLPDSTLVHGRMFVIAWDCGLEAVDDRAVELVLLAIKQRLRALLSAVLSRRSAYKLRDGRLLHTLGCAPPNPYLRFAARCHFSQGYSRTTAVTLAGEHQPCAPLSLDWAESKAALEVAADPSEHPPHQPVCAADLLETLQTSMVTTLGLWFMQSTYTACGTSCLNSAWTRFGVTSCWRTLSKRGPWNTPWPPSGTRAMKSYDRQASTSKRRPCGHSCLSTTSCVFGDGHFVVGCFPMC
ncbi:transcriptional adapter 1-like isoform X2 [Dermacentor variabilis]|uniref:transcriptional adapter 1-like isoform X2 n=1 Tax=Dermacentor variabilis TaxID=34621 RepID=UPI003F5B878A